MTLRDEQGRANGVRPRTGGIAPTAGQRPLGVVGDDVPDQQPNRPRIGERIQPTATDELEDLPVHDIQSAHHGRTLRERIGPTGARSAILWTMGRQVHPRG